MNHRFHPWLMLLVGGILLARVNAARAADGFPAPFNTEPAAGTGPPPAADSAAAFRLPEGMHATVFAAEPEVQNPIGCAWDPRGRLWIAENYTYAERPRRFESSLRDRVIILADRDGDGRADERRVFLENLQMLTTIEVGRGGVWLLCPPQLLFVPDRDGDDLPDGPAEVRLDGFTLPPESHHNFANGLRWGPDGWLYGRCGASGPGRVGRPGSPDSGRIPLHGGIWRYHPASGACEVLTHGTTNPWGHDWDRHGELFYINTVNGHLWHMLPNAHFVRSHTIDPNPYVYAPIDQHADHWHFDTGRSWSDTRGREGAQAGLGGGHAHCGALIYQADQWPEAWHNRLLTLNFHGRRLNVERLERAGGGYVGRHEPDIAFTADPWFRGMDLTSGPDGSVYVLDWADVGECHDSTGVHRTSGRIYRFAFQPTNVPPARPVPVDVAAATLDELVRMQTHRNDWWARRARSVLADRRAAGKATAPAVAPLRELLRGSSNPVHRLRALWTLYILDAAPPAMLADLLADPDEHLRTWAVRLLTTDWPLDTVLGPHPDRPERFTRAEDVSLRDRLAALAASDPSGLVRSTLASTVARLPVRERGVLARPLLARAEDAGDHNIPLLLWYALIPLAATDPAELATLGAACELPVTRRFVARRLAEDISGRPGLIEPLLLAAARRGSGVATDILTGLGDGLAGFQRATKPAGWDAVVASLQSHPELAGRVRELNVVFGDGRALADVRRVALDGKAGLDQRAAAVRTLIAARPPDLQATCERLLDVRFLNATAVRGLAGFADPAVAARLVRSYRQFHPSDRHALIDVLASRPVFARALLDEVAAGRIPRDQLTPFHARQIRTLNDAATAKQLAAVWGEVGDPGPLQQEFIQRLRRELTPEALRMADRSRGRLAFQQACAACHRLHGDGGTVGPDLTGAGRGNLDYLLENIVAPGAVVSPDFRMTVVTLRDGQVLNGIVAARSPAAVTLRTPQETMTIAARDVTSLEVSAGSLMPEGLLESLTPAQVRDLLAYLLNPAQVPLPADAR